MDAADGHELAGEPFPASLRDPQPASGAGRGREGGGRRRLPPGEAAPPGAEAADQGGRPAGDIAIAQLFLPDVYETQ
eukprot:5431458-Pleurochrysis_carterae.AAC.1